MTPQGEHEPREAVREFRLEGGTLVLVTLVLLALLVGAFYIGRWVERGRRPSAVGAAAEQDALGHVAVTGSPVDVDESTDFFDRASGEENQLEPQREMPAPSTARVTSPTPTAPAATPAPTDAPSTAAAAAAASGAFYVQVWAGRDRQAAELLVGKLQGEGYSVKLVSDRSSGDLLFKVRVGGYPDEAAARSAAAELDGKGYRGAWVTQDD